MKTIRRLSTVLVASLLLAGSLEAQVVVIHGGKIFTLSGPPIESGTVLIRDGIIIEVGASISIPADAVVIDAAGLEVYPGLFDAMTRLGLTEIGQVTVTNDMLELGEFNPHLLGVTAVHPSSEHIPVARANGITHVVAMPNARAGGIGGQGSLVHLDGWTVEEMLIESSVGFSMNWPNLRTREFDRATRTVRERSFREAKEQYDEQVEELAAWLAAARQYANAVAAGSDVPRDLKLEALSRAVAGELPLLVSAGTERQIRDVIAFAEENDVRVVILGGREAWRVADDLAGSDIPVILGPTQTLPGDEISYDRMYAQPGLLYEAGVTFALSTFNSASSRTLPYEAGSAVSFGLPHEEALKAITINAAEILGVGDRLGTIEPGKIANIIVTDGDPLEITTQVKHLIISGRPTSLDNKHLRLYEKYRARPKG